MSNGILRPDRGYPASGHLRLPRRLRGTIFRVCLFLVLGGIGFSVLRTRQSVPSPTSLLKDSDQQTIVIENCLGIEPLRHADDCFEAFDFSKGRQPKRVKKQRSGHLEHEEDIPWISSYGMVLDYDTVYDTFSAPSDEERYTTKRTLKCLIGSSMSIVWDIEFSTSLLHAYKNGVSGIESNATHSSAVSCPSKESESSASMSIKINCGYDVKRDSWGHPAREIDQNQLDTCVRMASSWVDTRVGEQSVQPWAGLCEVENDELKCDSKRFHLEGTD